MPTLQDRNEDRALHRWAVRQGYSDFDTYIRTGGSVMDCRRSLEHEREMANWALTALGRMGPPVEHPPSTREVALAHAEAEACGGNAHIQGFDDGSP